MFSNPVNPIAISFGSTSAKLLQLSSGEEPSIIAAAELPLPDNARQDTAAALTHYEQHLPKLLRTAGFKARRVVCSVPTHQTIVQHMQLASQEGIKREDLVKAQLQVQMGIMPNSAVVRSVDVTELTRAGQTRSEVICFAIPRDVVMRYVQLLEKLKMDVVGVHTETLAVLRAFDQMYQRKADENLTTMYIDLGWSGTHVAIAHGTKLVFARSIQVGGKTFDEVIAKQTKCDLHAARAKRLSFSGPVKPTTHASKQNDAARSSAADSQDSAHREVLTRIAATMEAGGYGGSGTDTGVTVTAGERRGTGVPRSMPVEFRGEPTDDVTKATNVDLSEVLDTIADELSMCLRYHHGLFAQRSIDRAVLVGGEARQSWLCEHVVRSIRVPARLGDPLAAISNSRSITTPGVDCSEPQPGWAVACGLAVAPNDG